MKYLEILANSKNANQAQYGVVPYILMLFACTIWPLSWIYINENNINFAQANMVRGLTVFVLNYLMCRYFNSSTEYKEYNNYKFLSLRSAFMIGQGFGYALSQYFLPLPISSTINASGTLSIFVIDYFMNGIKINIKQVASIIIGFLGSIIAVNGNLITKYFNPSYVYETKFRNYITDDFMLIAVFSIIFMGLMVVWAFGIVITKKVNANAYQINLILSYYLIFASALAYPFIESKCTKIELLTSFFLFGIPISIAQWCFNGSLTMTKHTGVLNMINFWSIFVGYVVSIFRYGETPNIVSLIGVSLVIFGVYNAIFRKSATA